MRFLLTRAAVLALAAGTCRIASGESGIDSPKGCDFDITGTWEAVPATSESPLAVRYRFGADGMAISLTQSGSNADEWVEKPGATVNTYRLDDSKAPSRIEFFAPGVSSARSSQEISQYDDGSFTTMDESSQPHRWIRVDPERYFILFVGLQGDVARGGPAFATLILAGTEGRASMASFGLYIADSLPIVGPIPTAVTAKHLVEARLDSETMLRLELTRAEYERAMAVLQSWERRAREQKLLYDTPYLNSIVFMEQLALTLNQCNERIHAKKLNWNSHDPITAPHNHPQIAFYYVRDLRKDNDSLHLRNEVFRERMGASCAGGCRAGMGR
ncbi:MAG: hypothetical protein ABI885_07015 [Gammaproteobacteria bacterium]